MIDKDRRLISEFKIWDPTIQNQFSINYMGGSSSSKIQFSDGVYMEGTFQSPSAHNVSNCLNINVNNDFETDIICSETNIVEVIHTSISTSSVVQFVIHGAINDTSNPIKKFCEGDPSYYFMKMKTGMESLEIDTCQCQCDYDYSWPCSLNWCNVLWNVADSRNTLNFSFVRQNLIKSCLHGFDFYNNGLGLYNVVTNYVESNMSYLSKVFAISSITSILAGIIADVVVGLKEMNRNKKNQENKDYELLSDG
jgi:hypothetical protein